MAWQNYSYQLMWELRSAQFECRNAVKPSHIDLLWYNFSFYFCYRFSSWIPIECTKFKIAITYQLWIYSYRGKRKDQGLCEVSVFSWSFFDPEDRGSMSFRNSIRSYSVTPQKIILLRQDFSSKIFHINGYWNIHWEIQFQTTLISLL
jgi:hypothetical protein